MAQATASSIEETTPSIGDRVEKVCPDCDEQLGHMVRSVTKLGRISRVVCSKCGKIGTYKADAPIDEKPERSKKPGAPYDGAKTFKSGQIIEHEVFGRGRVVTVLGNRMIDVLFEDRVRRLIHSRP